MKQGFTLIELLVALVISSMIISSLFLVFFQTQRVALTTQNVIDLDTQFSVLNNQLEKDVSGIFVPAQAHMSPEKVGNKEGAVASDKKETIKPLKNIFFSSNKGELLSELTFITSSPVRVYEHAKNSEVTPRMVRVYYRLIPDKNRKDLFVLTRQEGTDLDTNRYKPGPTSIRGYEIANNIKEITVQYSVPLPKQDQDKKDEKARYEVVKEWRDDEAKGTAQKRPKIPSFITMNITLWNNQKENTRTYMFEYPIASFWAEFDYMLTPTKSTPGKVASKPMNMKLPTTDEIKSMARELARMMDGA